MCVCYKCCSIGLLQNRRLRVNRTSTKTFLIYSSRNVSFVLKTIVKHKCEAITMSKLVNLIDDRFHSTFSIEGVQTTRNIKCLFPSG